MKKIFAGLSALFAISVFAGMGVTSPPPRGVADRAAVFGSNGFLSSSITSSTEIGYLLGTTANVQSQLNALQGVTGNFVLRAGDTMTGPLEAPEINGVTSSIFSYLVGLTSNVQTQIDENKSGIATLQGATTSLQSEIVALQGATTSLLDGITTLQGATTSLQAEVVALQGVTGSFVKKAGDTMTGPLGVSVAYIGGAIQMPQGTALSLGYDSDTGIYSTGDGNVTIKANDNPRISVNQNETTILGGISVTGDAFIDGNLYATINVSTATGTLPIANGGTGNTSMGAFGSIPYHTSSGILDTDWDGLHYDSTSQQLQPRSIGIYGTIVGVTNTVGYDGVRIFPTLQGDFQYINSGILAGPALDGVTLTGNIISFDSSISFTGDNVIPGYFDFNIHPNFSGLTSSVPYKGIGFNASLNDHDYVTFIDSNNIVGVTANITGSYKVLDLHDQFLSGATVDSFTAFNFTPTFASGAVLTNGYRGVNHQPTFNNGGLVGYYTGYNGQALGGVTTANPIEINIDTSNLRSSTAFNRPKGLNHGGPGVLNWITGGEIFSSFPTGVDTFNSIITIAGVTSGSPVSGSGALAINMPFILDAADSISADPAGIGLGSIGAVNLFAAQTGVTVAEMSGMFGVVVNSIGQLYGSDGGHLQVFNGFRTPGAYPGGGSNTFGDINAFRADAGFCTSATGVCRGIDIRDPAADNYLAGTVTLDDLTATTVPYLDANKTIQSSSVTPTELGYLSGATANIQNQIESIQGATTSLQSEIVALQGATTSLLDGVTTLQGATTSLQAEVVALQGATTSLQSQVTALQGVTGSFVKKAGDTMTGPLAITDAGVTALVVSGNIVTRDSLGVGGKKFSQTASASLANSTSETSILSTGAGSLTFSANTLQVGDVISFRTGGFLSCTSTPTLTLRFKIAGLNVVAQNVTPSSIDTGGDTENYCDTNDKIFNMTVLCTIRAVGVSGSVFCAGGEARLFSNNKSGGVINMGAGSATTIDTTSSISIGLTGQWDAASTDNEIQTFNAVLSLN